MDAVTLSANSQVFKILTMPIYTRTGDNGTTALFGGKRVGKDHLLIEAYGSLDECSSFIGLVTIKKPLKSDLKLLTDIQHDLYVVMGFLAGANTNLMFLQTKVKMFEKKIDEIEKKLPPLHNFVISQGSPLSVLFHVARTICRRSERNLVAYINSTQQTNNQFNTLLIYINRLSDLLFSLARSYNKKYEITTK